jgi:hypothetical protein
VSGEKGVQRERKGGRRRLSLRGTELWQDGSGAVARIVLISDGVYNVTLGLMAIKVAHSHPPKLNLDLILVILTPTPMQYYVPSTPPPMRGRAYSLSQPSQQYYPPTPYSGNTLNIPYTPGVSRSGTYYVAPTVSGRRSRSHSRPRHGHSHHRSSHHHSGHHGHSRRSHSVGAHRQHYNRPSVNVRVSISFINRIH